MITSYVPSNHLRHLTHVILFCSNTGIRFNQLHFSDEKTEPQKVERSQVLGASQGRSQHWALDVLFPKTPNFILVQAPGSQDC